MPIIEKAIKMKMNEYLGFGKLGTTEIKCINDYNDNGF